MEPTDLVSQLRSELASSVETPVPDGLFAAAQRRARQRTRQRRALVSGLGLVLLSAAALGTLRWSDGGSPEDVATGPPGTTDGTASSPDGGNGFSTEGAGILLAVRPNGPGFAVVDLDDGTIRQYPPGSHTLPEDAVSGATVTPRGDAVVWQDGMVHLLAAADFSQAPLEMAPTRVRSDEVYTPSFRVASSPDGSQLWIVQAPFTGETTSLVDLVDADTGANIDTFEVDLHAEPVAATEDSLIVNTGTSDSSDQNVVRLDSDGTTHEVATGARGIAVYGDTVATVDPSGAEMSLVDVHDGHELVVEPPSPGRWTTVGEDIIAGESGPLPVVSPDGELLVQIGRGNLDNGDYVSSPYALSMVDGTSRPLADFDGPPSPAPLAWSADGEHVVTTENAGLPDADRYTIAMLDSDATGRGATVVAELESGYFPLAAG